MNSKTIQAGDMFQSINYDDVVIAVKNTYGDVWELYNISTNMYMRDYCFALTNSDYYTRLA